MRRKGFFMFEKEYRNLEIIEINQTNLIAFKNLAQAYEAEFSKLTHKMPDQFGLFKIDIHPFLPYIGHLLLYKKCPVGFSIIDVESTVKDIAEFYIVPVMRGKNFGYHFACSIFNKYPGQWQVRQIENADAAISFWRSVIKKYTADKYEESVVSDPDWGVVTCQRFTTPSQLPDLIPEFFV